MSGLIQDARYACRYLARQRAATAVAVITLAVGIGAMTAVFSVVESVVLRPLPVADPDRVAFVCERWKGQDGNVSAGNFVDLRAAGGSSFAALAAIQTTNLSLTGGDRPERILAARASGAMFAVFGARPAIGRAFTAAEEEPGRDDVAVLGHGLWSRRFGADPRTVGRSIQLSGHAYRVVGVMGEGFDPTLSGEEIWLPLALTEAQRAQHDEHVLTVVGRLAPGATRGRAQAELGAAMAGLAQRYPDADRDRGVSVRPLAEVLIGDYRQRLLLLLAAVGLVQLIACSNVVNLLLAQGAVRARELAVRVAIGAERQRLVRQLLTESAVLGLLAGVAGTVVAALGIHLLLASAPAGIPRLAETRIDATVLAFALGVALASSVGFGLAPALRAARLEPQRALKPGERGLGAVRDRLRSGLVLVEVAVSLTLLTGAGLLIRSSRQLEAVRAGFEPDGVVTAQIALPETAYRDAARVRAAFAAMLERLAQAPGVSGAAVVSRAPLGPRGSSNGLLPEGLPMRPENLVDASLRVVTPGYFAVLRIPIVRGRAFDGRDGESGERVMLVSRELARRVWGREDPVGRRIACCDGTAAAPGWRTVVGVVGDVRSDGPTIAVVPEFYLPLAQLPRPAVEWLQRSLMLVARGARPGVLATAIRRAVAAVDPSLPVYGAFAMREALRAATAEDRFHSLALTVLGGVGLALAVSGIYSVLAYFTGLRAREMAIRMALGATPLDLVRLLAWQGLRPVLAGLALGCCTALAATRVLAGWLHGVGAADPLTLGGVVLVVLAASLAATLIPARRAARTDAALWLQAQ